MQWCSFWKKERRWKTCDNDQWGRNSNTPSHCHRSVLLWFHSNRKILAFLRFITHAYEKDFFRSLRWHRTVREQQREIDLFKIIFPFSHSRYPAQSSLQKTIMYITYNRSFFLRRERSRVTYLPYWRIRTFSSWNIETIPLIIVKTILSCFRDFDHTSIDTTSNMCKNSMIFFLCLHWRLNLSV